MNAEKIPFPDKRPPPPLQSSFGTKLQSSFGTKLQSSFGTKPESTRQKALDSRARVLEFASSIPKPFTKVKREVSFSHEVSDASSQVRACTMHVKLSFSALLAPSIIVALLINETAGAHGAGNSGCQARAQPCSCFRNSQSAGHLAPRCNVPKRVVVDPKLLQRAHNNKHAAVLLLCGAWAPAASRRVVLETIACCFVST